MVENHECNSENLSRTIYIPQLLHDIYAGLGYGELRSNPPYLDSGETIPYFQKASKHVPCTYQQGSIDTVQLAAGNNIAKCIGTGTLQYSDLILKIYIHVESLNGILVSVPQICDQKKIVLFTEHGAFIFNTELFSVDPRLKACLTPRFTSGMYCFSPISGIQAKSMISLSVTSNTQLMHRSQVHTH